MRYNAIHSHSLSSFVAACTGHVSPRCCLRESIDKLQGGIMILIAFLFVYRYSPYTTRAVHMPLTPLILFLSEVLTALPIFLTFPTFFFLPSPSLSFVALISFSFSTTSTILNSCAQSQRRKQQSSSRIVSALSVTLTESQWWARAKSKS